jgi:hypothetical protein
MMAFLEDQDEDPAKQRVVYQFFGSFTRSFISMFEIAFHNHAPIMRKIIENVDERWAIYFLLYKCVVGLSVMKVISGVFMHETFKVCSEDDELMIIQKKRDKENWTRKMHMLYSKLNKNGDEALERWEFLEMMKEPWLHTWLSAMELDFNDPEALWELLDDGDGNLTAEELVKGVSKLRGSAKSADMHRGLKELHDAILLVKDMHLKTEAHHAETKEMDKERHGQILQMLSAEEKFVEDALVAETEMVDQRLSELNAEAAGGPALPSRGSATSAPPARIITF